MLLLFPICLKNKWIIKGGRRRTLRVAAIDRDEFSVSWMCPDAHEVCLCLLLFVFQNPFFFFQRRKTYTFFFLKNLITFFEKIQSKGLDSSCVVCWAFWFVVVAERRRQISSFVVKMEYIEFCFVLFCFVFFCFVLFCFLFCFFFLKKSK